MCYCEGLTVGAACGSAECESRRAPEPANLCYDPAQPYGDYLAGYYEELKAHPDRHADVLSRADRFVSGLRRLFPLPTA